MSTVVFPFRHSETEMLERSTAIASSHRAVEEVVLVGDLPPQPEVLGMAARVAQSTGTAIAVIAQERIGSLRPGKGDAMLSGLRRFVEGNGRRLHFYDADISSFTPGWIDVAERALDDGADVAKHFFHRAATDAQITWHITKPGAAILWPRSRFPDVHQPLGGELALSRTAAETLWADPLVRERSDWGIDTVLTFAMLRSGLSIHEVPVPEGKEHGYYDALSDLTTMLCECLDALQRLARHSLPEVGTLRFDPPGQVPESIRNRVAYDVEASRQLLEDAYSPAGSGILSSHPVLDPRVPGEWADDRWGRALRVLLDHFVLGDPAWEEVAFRAWVARVLRHTEVVVPLGYEASMEALRRAVGAYRR